MQTGESRRGVKISPHLMLLTVRQLARENAELFEEVKQLRAAVNVYRELATRKGLVKEKVSSLGAIRPARNRPNDHYRSNVA
ncbi:MAG: hypothetical protein ABSH42_10205 [Bryobacteraceae bacterium]|jgi:hypothetical protein